MNINARLELENYFLTRLHLDFNLPKNAEVHIENLTTEFDLDSLINKSNPLLRRLTLRVNAAEYTKEREQVGYQLECEITGQFKIPDDIPEEHREGLLRVNGISILYSTLRGILGSLSGSFPTRLCLPTILPNEVFEHIQKAKSRTKKKATKKRIAKKS